MSVENSSGSAKPDDAHPANAQKSADDSDPATVIEIAELRKELRDLKGSLGGLIRRQKESKPTTENDSGEPVHRGKSADDEWKSRVKTLEDRDRAINERAAKVSIESAFSDSGVSGDYKKDAVRDFKDDFGDKLIYTVAGDVLVRASEIDEPVPVDQFIKSLVNSKRYDRFRPAVNTPKIGVDGKPVPGKQKMSVQQYQAQHAKGVKLDLSKIELV